jgi:hypothetical protein
MKYRLLIDYAVIEFLETLSRKEQQLLRKHFLAILALPRQFPITPSLTARVAAWTSTSAANSPSSFGKTTPTGI